jgi:hypothetical protein
MRALANRRHQWLGRADLAHGAAQASTLDLGHRRLLRAEPDHAHRQVSDASLTNAAPGYQPAHLISAALYVGAGDIDKAKESMAIVQRLTPEALRGRTKIKAGSAPAATDAGSEARLRYQTFLRVAAGVDPPSAADALR